MNPTISNSKLYHQHKQDFPQLRSTHKSLKCTECAAAFNNYQEICTHNQLHLSFVQENRPVQNMNIVESQNICGYMTSNSRLEKSPEVMPNSFITTDIIETVSPTKNDRAACALHCSMCNHTFTNRIQLINHQNLTHCDDDAADTSCDNDNLMNEDQKIHDLRSRSFEHTAHSDIQNLTYSQNSDSAIEAINYSAHMGLDTRNLVNNDTAQLQRQDINSGDSDLSSSPCSDQILRFSSFNDVEMHHENDQRQSHDLPSREVFKDSILPEDCTITQKKLHKCNLCDKSFSQKSKLVTHTLRHTGERPFACLHCDKAYTSKSKLNAHTRLHTQINVHRCTVCDKSFPYPSYLTEHSKVHNIKESSSSLAQRLKKFECSICKKQFRLLKNLKIHLKLHTGKGLVRCEICHKAFGQKYNLKVHLRTHNIAGKFYKCNYCGKSFSARGNFVEHLRIHTKVKPFNCSMCPKKFSQSSHLKTHEATHNSLRPHQCRLCGKRYKLAAHLRRHANTHSATKSYKCELCEQLFSQAFSLKRHLKRHNDTQT